MQTFHNDGLFNESLPLMNELRLEGKLCDVTLKVEDQSFSAHRIILAGAIPYFRAMFTNNMAESRMEEITLKGIEPCALESLISYTYTATVRVDKQNARNLLMAASFLQLDKVRDACVDFLTSHLGAHNVLSLCHLGDSLGCNNLVQAANTYINIHFSEIAESQEFLLLTSDQLIEIIQRDELKVRTEEIVFEACLRWSKYNREERSEQFPAVLSKVRLSMLTPLFLVDHVCNEELVETSPECRKLVDEAKNYHLYPERRPQLQSFSTQPRCPYEEIFIIALKEDRRLAVVQIFDPLIGSLTEGTSIETGPQWYIESVAVGTKVYLFDDFMHIYDSIENKWSKGCHIPSLEECPAVATLNGYIYLCGGARLKTVSCFCTKTGVLGQVADMRQERVGAVAISLDKFVYVLGGYTEHDGISSTVERYDPLTNTWINVRSMVNARENFHAAALNGKLYVCSGYDGKSCLPVEVYDPNTDTWNSVAQMTQKQGNFGLVSYANKLWAIGGNDDEGEFSLVEVYDPETNKWTFWASMNVPNECIAAGIIRA